MQIENANTDVLLRIKDLCFSYPQSETYVLNQLNLDVCAGDFVVICGSSGCGKTTLLRHLKPSLRPSGDYRGKIFFNNKPLSDLNLREQTEKIAFVQQDPESQIVTDKVWHELAFGLESLSYDNATIKQRVAEMASFFGIQNWFYKDIKELSGGQKQLLNLASVMTLNPQLLILDEPTSMLDPIAANDFLNMLVRINRELATTIILTEHRLEDVLPLANKMVVLEKACVLYQGSPYKVGQLLQNNEHSMFLAMPAATRIWSACQKVKGNSVSKCSGSSTNLNHKTQSALDDNNYAENSPLTVKEGRTWLNEYSSNHKLKEIPVKNDDSTSKNIVLEAKDIWFRYDKTEPDILKSFSLKLYEKDFLAVLGGNGTGKSTMLKIICGLLKPYKGNTKSDKKIALMPQDPKTLFTKSSVYDDLEDVFYNSKLENNTIENKIQNVCDVCHLNAFLDRHPYDLSGGEQQRLSLAKILLTNPDIILLDEPTKGLDVIFKIEFADIIKQLQKEGKTIVMVSHDIEFCAQYAQKCALMFDGAIINTLNTRHFFAGNHFYTSAANRISNHLIKNAITVDDVIFSCGSQIKKILKPKTEDSKNKIDETVSRTKEYSQPFSDTLKDKDGDATNNPTKYSQPTTKTLKGKDNI
ncbi:MAG: ATP-binding cassette domain-containing protein, partial [Coriobacteriales bacterium]|nr:ATP-binding cassette domain-containing protein [Coriobacteriales bacterium]